MSSHHITSPHITSYVWVCMSVYVCVCLYLYVCVCPARLGASPGWGGGRRLLDIVGRSQALRLLGTAQILGPDEALAMGLADAVLLPPSSPSACQRSEALSVSHSYVEQGVLFVEPFTSMPYPGAVKDMKRLVAGLSSHRHLIPPPSNNDLDTDPNTNPNTNPNPALGTCDGEQLEKLIFRKRWGSKDNLTALSLKK